ncbi:unnamed protein product [Prunus brigantina]
MSDFLERKPHGRVGMRQGVWSVGEQGLGKVPTPRTPRCDNTPGLLNCEVPSYLSHLYLLQWEDGWASMGGLGVSLVGLSLGLRPLPVTLQGAVVMLQLDVLGMKMFAFLGHLGNAGAKALHLCLEVHICRRFPSGSIPSEGMVLSIGAILGRHSRVWGKEKATGPDGRRSQLAW